ncbi:MAG: hypothetical protein ACK4NC_02050 [Candidatus Gracilibacteria bacterium]
MQNILPILLLVVLLFSSCSTTVTVSNQNSSVSPIIQNSNNSEPILQNVQNQNATTQSQIATTINKGSIGLQSDKDTCSLKVLQGTNVVLPDLVNVIKKSIPDAKVGKVDDLCYDAFTFQQILDTDHILMQLPGDGREHPSFGKIYVLTLADQKLLPLEYFNKKYTSKYASMSVSTDGKRALFVQKDAPKDLVMFRFDQNKDTVIKTLRGNETWDGTEFWSDVTLTVDWLSEKQVEVTVYKDNNERKELRKEKVTLE